MDKAYEMASLDVRSLALWRIGLALVTLGDLCDRWSLVYSLSFVALSTAHRPFVLPNRCSDLYAHYSAQGALPSFVLLGTFWSDEYVC